MCTKTLVKAMLLYMINMIVSHQGKPQYSKEVETFYLRLEDSIFQKPETGLESQGGEKQKHYKLERQHKQRYVA